MMEDRISLLPDCLLVEILSRLPDTKYAIRTGVLAKRWLHLWTFVHNLVFNRSYKSSPHDDQTAFFSLVDKALTQCRQFNIDKFEVKLYHGYGAQFEPQVHNWFRYAVACNVKELNMQVLNRDLESKFVLKEDFIFINLSFTRLSLEGCLFNYTGSVCWANLESLCISHGNLGEGMIENILSGCPLLETLTLSNCYGYSRLDITSKSVKNLVFSGYATPAPDDRFEDLDDGFKDLDDIIEINAPNILSLTIEDHLSLWKLSLLNVSSLVKADLNYVKLGHYETTRKKAKEEMLKGFIPSLGHVNELKIGSYCFEALSRLKAKGFTFPSNLKTYSLMDGRSAVVS